MKKFILGFLTAALLFSAMPIGAAVQQYVLTPTTSKITVDGKTVTDAKLPIMAYQGYNYIPASTFKSICDKIGIGFKWDGTSKEIQLATSSSTATSAASTKALATTTTSTTSNMGVKTMATTDKIKETPDGITNIDTWEGKQYIGINYIQNVINKKGYDIVPSIKTNKFMLIKGNSPDFKYNLKSKESEYAILIDDVPTVSAYGGHNIEANYYINTILPLIK